MGVVTKSFHDTQASTLSIKLNRSILISYAIGVTIHNASYYNAAVVSGMYTYQALVKLL